MKVNRLVLSIFILMFFCALSYGEDDPATMLLGRIGVSQVRSSVSDFELQSLKGELKKLSDDKGHWIFLTFWATWCGPCKYEMPLIDKLANKLRAENVKFYGISIDTSNDKKAVKKFVKEHDIKMSILLDDENKVSSAYQANSVPSLYIISPDWKLVGVFRGAKDWSQDFDIIQKLSKLKEVHGKVDEAGEVVLPNNLSAPIIKMSVLGAQFKVGKSFTLEIAVTMKDNAYFYNVKTPIVTVPEGITISAPRSESTSSVLGSTLRYVYRVNSRIDGNITIGPAELKFSPRKGGEELSSRAPALKVTIEKSSLLPYIVLVMILFIAGFVFFYLRWKKIKAKCVQIIVSSHDIDVKRYSALKMDGRPFHSELLEEFSKTLQNNEEEAKIKSRIDKIRYAGNSLSDQEVDYYEKLVKKYIDDKTDKGDD